MGTSAKGEMVHLVLMIPVDVHAIRQAGDGPGTGYVIREYG